MEILKELGVVLLPIEEPLHEGEVVFLLARRPSPAEIRQPCVRIAVKDGEEDEVPGQRDFFLDMVLHRSVDRVARAAVSLASV